MNKNETILNCPCCEEHSLHLLQDEVQTQQCLHCGYSTTNNYKLDKVGNVNIPINGGDAITGTDDTYGNYVSLSQRTNNYYTINNPSFRTLVTNNGNKLTFKVKV